MFGLKLEKDYVSVRKECGKLQDEVVFYREKYAEAEHSRKELETRLESMYEQARLDAAKRSQLAEQLVSANKEINSLSERVGTGMTFGKFNEYLNPEPEDAEIRAAYVSQIAGFFNGGLRDYLRYTIQSLKDEVIRFPLSERETDFYRAGVNVCSLLIEWGDRMAREHYANAQDNIEDTSDAFMASDESVENIKRATKRK